MVTIQHMYIALVHSLSNPHIFHAASDKNLGIGKARYEARYEAKS